MGKSKAKAQVLSSFVFVALSLTMPYTEDVTTPQGLGLLNKYLADKTYVTG
jgi:hypothetical protein